MKEKPLTNETGEVRELTAKNIRAMRSAGEVLPADLLKILLSCRERRDKSRLYK